MLLTVSSILHFTTFLKIWQPYLHESATDCSDKVNTNAFDKLVFFIIFAKLTNLEKRKKAILSPEKETYIINLAEIKILKVKFLM